MRAMSLTYCRLFVRALQSPSCSPLVLSRVIPVVSVPVSTRRSFSSLSSLPFHTHCKRPYDTKSTAISSFFSSTTSESNSSSTSDSAPSTSSSPSPSAPPSDSALASSSPTLSSVSGSSSPNSSDSSSSSSSDSSSSSSSSDPSSSSSSDSSSSSSSSSSSDSSSSAPKVIAKANTANRGFIRWEHAFMTATLLIAVVYQYERLKHQKETKAVSDSKTIGTASLGGPFELVDMYGKPVSDKDLLGKYALLYFGFTFCPDICPNELRKMDRALKEVDAMAEVGRAGILVQPVFITVDPARDTPDRLKSYSRQSGAHPRTIWLTGSHEQLKKIAKAYRMYYSPPPKTSEDYQVDHSIFFFLLSPEGKFLDYYGKNFSDHEVAQKMRTTILNNEIQRRSSSAEALPTPQAQPQS